MTKQPDETLGNVLKKLRELRNLALRQVEALTGISNGYISQLENDKVKKPSADILNRLAEFYKVDFYFLLQMAGLAEKQSAQNRSLGPYVFSKHNLTKEEEDELINYLQYIRKRKKK